MRRRALLQAFALAPLLATSAGLLAMPAQRVLRLGAPRATPRRVFAAGPPAAVLLAAVAPERLLGWPMKVSPDALAQLPALLFLLATAALGWQAWRQPRPLHTAMLLALLCTWWMLPRIFLQPVMLPARFPSNWLPDACPIIRRSCAT